MSFDLFFVKGFLLILSCLVTLELIKLMVRVFKKYSGKYETR